MYQILLPESSILRSGILKGPQGVPRGFPTADLQDCARFLGSILRSFSMPKSIIFWVDFFSRKKWPFREVFDGFWSRSKMADLQKSLKNWREIEDFQFFAHWLLREVFSGMRPQNGLKIGFKMHSEWRPKRGPKSRRKWLQDKTAISGICNGLESSSEAPMGREKGKGTKLKG